MIDDLLQVKVSKLPTLIPDASTASRADLSFSNVKNYSVHCCGGLDILPSLYIPDHIPAPYHVQDIGQFSAIIPTPIEVY
ncbi:uncharacterized protein N7511_002021 [Penicillium nucicola]|uniref:uncharacterized protein n=1 Tax=Penicillium nucicola TaxID=1850975 RepID=UPI002544FABD|nr:uncharacterized protein N7511_002021 [Penicillium nucicola]KAJ5769970.1 hypothetical protein N7511_002021 [Penicillium nucicola]